MNDWISTSLIERPASGDVQVVYLPRMQYTTWPAIAEPLLSASELDFAQRLTHPDIRQRFLFTRGTLRLLLGHMLHVPPQDLRLSFGHRGKPLLDCTSVHFNLSHSRDASLLAFSHDAEVGVDVESMHRIVRIQDMMRRFFHPEEQAWWQEQPHADRAFLELWTRKEAWLKRTGDGIAVSLRTVNTRSPALAERLFNIQPDQQHVAAVALSHDADLHFFRWEPPV